MKSVKKLFLSIALIATLITHVPAKAAYFIWPSAYTLALVFVGVSKSALVAGIFAPYIVLPEGSSLGPQDDATRKTAIGIVGSLVAISALIVLDETSGTLKLAELDQQTQFAAGLSNSELQAYNQNRSLLEATINSTVEAQARMGWDGETAHAHLVALAESELPADALAAYKKIIQAAHQE